MDPLATFENTQRQITLAFDVVSANLDEAIANLGSVNKLIEFLYPVYEGNSRTQQNTLKAAPLIGLEWTNLISQPHGGQRLVGYLGGVNYSPEIAEGGFIRGDKSVSTIENITNDTTVTEISAMEMNAGMQGATVDTTTTTLETTTTTRKSFIPKKLNISLDYTVLHTHLVGWASPSAALQEAAEQGGQEARYTFGSRGSENGRFPNSHMIQNVNVTNQSTTTSEVRTAPLPFRQAEEDAVLDPRFLDSLNIGGVVV